MARTFERLEHPRSILQEVVERLRTWIAAQAEPDGVQLPSERVLAAELGVSRSTVREAIHIMESMGVVETRHGKGTFAVNSGGKDWLKPLLWRSKDSSTLLIDLLEARLVVEPELARAAARNATAETIEQLWRFHETRSRADLDERVQTGIDLHQVIADLAGNSVLSYMLASAFALYGNLQDEANEKADPDELRSFQDEQNILHRKVLVAIETQDPDHAANLMRRHLEETKDYYRALTSG